MLGIKPISHITQSGRGTTRAENAQGKAAQSHISPTILVYEDNAAIDTSSEMQVHGGPVCGAAVLRGGDHHQPLSSRRIIQPVSSIIFFVRVERWVG